MIKFVRAVYAASRHDVMLPGLSAIFGGKEKSAPPPPPPPAPAPAAPAAPAAPDPTAVPTPEDPAVTKAAETQRVAQQRRRGLLATNLTRGAVGDEPMSRRAKLLGGGRNMAG